MAKLLTEYMPSSNAGETQPSMNATIVRVKQRSMLYNIVGITSVVVFGPCSASYVIMATITSLDIWMILDTIISITLAPPQTLLPMPRLLGSFCLICHLILQLELQRIDMLPVQLQTPASCARSTAWLSAGEIYPLTTARHVCQQELMNCSKTIMDDSELGVWLEAALFDMKDIFSLILRLHPHHKSMLRLHHIQKSLQANYP